MATWLAVKTLLLLASNVFEIQNCWRKMLKILNSTFRGTQKYCHELFYIPFMYFASLTEVECSFTVQDSKKSRCGDKHYCKFISCCTIRKFQKPIEGLGFCFLIIFLEILKKKLSVLERIKISFIIRLSILCTHIRIMPELLLFRKHCKLSVIRISSQ